MVCYDCGTSEQTYFYRRNVAGNFDAYHSMACDWSSTGNVQGTDFSVYDRLNAALEGGVGFNSGAQDCTFGTKGAGFPNDCFAHGKYLVSLDVAGCPAGTSALAPFSRNVDIYVLDN